MKINAKTDIKVSIDARTAVEIARNVLISTIDKDLYFWLKTEDFCDLSIRNKNELYVHKLGECPNYKTEDVFIKKISKDELLIFNIIKDLENFKESSFEECI